MIFAPGTTMCDLSVVAPKTHKHCESAHALRGIAALAVAWFHFTNGQAIFLPEGSLLRLSGSYGYLGVAVFFVISGFVIPYSLDRRCFDFPMMLRNLLFVVSGTYPPYVVALILTIVLTAVSSHVPGSHATMPDFGVATIMGNLTYTAPWIGGEWASPIFWSLAIEIQFYLVAAIFAPALLSKKRLVIFTTLFAISSCLSFVPVNRTFLFWYLPTFGAGVCWFLYHSKRLSFIDASAQALGFVVVAWITMGLQYAIAIAFAFATIAMPVRKSVPIFSSWNHFVFRLPLALSYWRTSD